MDLRKLGLRLVSTALLVIASSSAALSQAEKKVAYGILVDNSGSLRSQFPLVINLSKAIVAKTHQRGPVSIFPFNSSGRGYSSPLVSVLGIDWNQNKDLLDKYLESIYVVGGQTALVDAINAVASHLNTKVNLQPDAFGDKVIFLVTDGEERSSKLKEKDLIKILKSSGIKVYAVGLVQELDDINGFGRRQSKGKAIAFLENITRETGGRAVIPKSKNVDVDAVMSQLFAESPAQK